jgi:hydroxyacyl-ACP dehydratase HTD2-like protein with hotdog domain
MWAGGSFTWPKSTDKDRMLRIGNKVIEKRGIANIEHKVKGDMIFIHQQRIIWNKDLEGEDDKWGVNEIRTHVFRPPSSLPPVTASPSRSPPDTNTSTKPNTDTNTNKKEADISFTYTPTSPLLFRYSALTFNAHKIHYDHPHTVSHEQQRTLLVHGPLTATLLIELAVQAGIERGKELVGFEYRAVGPIYVDERVELSGWWDGNGDGLELEARQGGRLGMKASTTFA